MMASAALVLTLWCGPAAADEAASSPGASRSGEVGGRRSMNTAIWRFRVDRNGKLKMPADSHIVSVSLNEGVLYVYALCSTSSDIPPNVQVRGLYLNGHPLPPAVGGWRRFIDTFQVGDERYHFFDEGPA